MSESNKYTALVIGAGPAGLAASIRLALKGYEVTVFEHQTFPGGKLSEFSLGHYRFDFGPSVFTMPALLDELFYLAGKNPRDYYNYHRVDPLCHYFYEDGIFFKAPSDPVELGKAIETTFGEPAAHVHTFLKQARRKHELTNEVFLQNSLHKFQHYLSQAVWKGILNFGAVDAFRTMHKANEALFKDPRVVQLFDRYATYNGSSPYLAPATLNIIPHYEMNEGIYYPEGGMYRITQSLYALATDIGVKFRFGEMVHKINLQGKRAIGVSTTQGDYPAEVVVSNMDIYNTYHKLLPEISPPKKILTQERSSSALVFYWGMNKAFPKLDLHNIFFSKDYQAEFDSLFKDFTLTSDPTVYINITSKHSPMDAPAGGENWFTMINAPAHKGQDWDTLIPQARTAILQKLSRLLGTEVEKHIVCEKITDPRVIESRTFSFQGSIYGNSSNNKFAAFLRHPNFSSRLKNVYFCGGSVHPGGSIPLSLLSAKIAINSLR